MKPHRLTMTAFGPFAERAVVDFDDLDHAGIFLISGPVGAGKTFVFDGLCFALYGDVSGSRRADELASDFAPFGTPPVVELEFTADGQRWRIRRTAAHARPKHRGAGTIDEQANAELAQWVDGGWNVLSTRQREVNARAHRLIGLTPSEFRQVVLLPQGEFAHALGKTPTEREALLKRLFDTSLYERAESWLIDQVQAKQAKVAAGEEAMASLRSQALRLLPSLDQQVQETVTLSTMVEISRQRAEASLTDLEQATKRADRAEAARRDAEELAALFDRRQALDAHQDDLVALRPTMLELRAIHDAAVAAEALRIPIGRAAAARGELTSATRQLDAAITATSGPVPGLDSNTIIPDGSPGTLRAASDQLTRHRATIEALAERATTAAEAHDRATGCERALAAIDERVRAAATTRDRLQTEHDEIALLADQTAAALARRPALLSRRTEAERLMAAAAEADAAEVRLGRADATCRRRAEEMLEQKSIWLDLYQAHLDNQAAQLARELTDDQPCRVCGSTDHPDPASTDSPSIDQGDVDRARGRFDEAEARSGDAALARNKIDHERTRWLAILGDHDRSTLPSQLAAAKSELRATDELLTRAASTTHLDRLAHDIDALDDAVASAGAETTRLTIELESCRATADATRAELAEQLGDRVPLDVLQAIDQRSRALGALQSHHDATASARSIAGEAERHLSDALRASPFDDETEAVAAQRNDLDDIASRINRYEHDVADTIGALVASDLSNLPADRPAVGSARQVARDALVHKEELISLHTLAARDASEVERFCHEATRRETELVVHRDDAELFAQVTDQVRGETAPRLSLQRWVLAGYLAEICDHANDHLSDMSQGRYRLSVSDDSLGGNRKAGLDLAVDDAYTGERRAVHSLSGGETFIVSLALALAVADVVKARNGGVRVDSLFIDEGFGSLDPETLDLAIQQLDRLREGGRLVGVVSHVPALAEQIRAGIAVRKSPTGSTLRPLSATSSNHRR